MATYFTVYPEEVIRFEQECLKAQEEAEEWEKEISERVQKYIFSMKKGELQQTLLELLFSGPDWQFERFIREHDLDEY